MVPLPPKRLINFLRRWKEASLMPSSTKRATSRLIVLQIKNFNLEFNSSLIRSASNQCSNWKNFFQEKTFSLQKSATARDVSKLRARTMRVSQKFQKWFVPPFNDAILNSPDCDFPENFCTYPNIQQMIHDQHFTLELEQPQRWADDLWRLVSHLEEYWQSVVSLKVRMAVFINSQL